MSFSKVLKYTAFVVAGLFGFIGIGEIYYKMVEVLKEKLNTPDENREISEAFCTQGVKNYESYLTRQIKFTREKSLFITEVIENMIKSAQRQVHVAMYIFTNHVLCEALKEAQRHGVKVYVIVDHTMESASGSQVHAMRAVGIDVKIYSRSTMHHKFCLIDAPSCDEMEIFSAISDNKSKKKISFPKHGLLITGSLNWTREALSSNVENFIVTSDRKLIKDYQHFFYDCWNQ